jgi:hypothetical protein
MVLEDGRVTVEEMAQKLNIIQGVIIFRSVKHPWVQQDMRKMGAQATDRRA